MAPARSWQDLATVDFDDLDAGRTVALLPVGAVEQHGPHLPLATDAIIGEGIVARLLAAGPREARVLALPMLPVGDSLEHTAYPGTLTIGADGKHDLSDVTSIIG